MLRHLVPSRAARPRRTVAVLLAVTALSAVGCAPKDQKAGGATTTDGGPTTTFDMPSADLVDMTGQASVTIEARDNEMVPRYVEITAGTKVTFTNAGRNPHDLVPFEDGAFESVQQANFGPGRAHVVTFPTAGDFPYYCSVHGTMKHGMNGAIRVVPAK